MVALETYKVGHGNRGKLWWRPDEDILEALDASFYKAFKVIIVLQFVKLFRSFVFSESLSRTIPGVGNNSETLATALSCYPERGKNAHFNEIRRIN